MFVADLLMKPQTRNNPNSIRIQSLDGSNPAVEKNKLTTKQFHDLQKNTVESH